jgi:hypothetical protein
MQKYRRLRRFLSKDAQIKVHNIIVFRLFVSSILGLINDHVHSLESTESNDKMINK